MLVAAHGQPCWLLSTLWEEVAWDHPDARSETQRRNDADV